MQPHEGALSNGRPPSPARLIGARSELDGLRSACRRQARLIERLTAVASNLRSGAAALKADNAELRSANERMERQSGDGAARGGALAVCLPLDARAPGAARMVVGRLRGRVPASVLEDARLVVSELVTNSVCHSGASTGAVVVVRAELIGTMVRLEVEDPGCDGVIAPREPDLGGGFGLNLVQRLSERWGLERVAAGGTRVWAHLARASAPTHTEAPGCRAAGAVSK
jgi:anti-sigma regulatory factor (Ser/Thr protein kinase)